MESEIKTPSPEPQQTTNFGEVKETIRILIEEYWKKDVDFIEFCREYFDDCSRFEQYNADHALHVARSGRIIILHPLYNTEPTEDFDEATLIVLSSEDSAKRLIKIMRELDEFLGLFFPHRRFAEFLAAAVSAEFYKVDHKDDLGLVFHVYELQL